ncbi:MAG: hypothetical protein ACFFAX_13175 [Promethearchaeota archaeon]
MTKNIIALIRANDFEKWDFEIATLLPMSNNPDEKESRTYWKLKTLIKAIERMEGGATGAPLQGVSNAAYSFTAAPSSAASHELLPDYLATLPVIIDKPD